MHKHTNCLQFDMPNQDDSDGIFKSGSVDGRSEVSQPYFLRTSAALSRSESAQHPYDLQYTHPARLQATLEGSSTQDTTSPRSVRGRFSRSCISSLNGSVQHEDDTTTGIPSRTARNKRKIDLDSESPAVKRRQFGVTSPFIA